MPKKCCEQCAHAEGPFDMIFEGVSKGDTYLCTCAKSDACFDLVDAGYGCKHYEQKEDEINDPGR